MELSNEDLLKNIFSNIFRGENIGNVFGIDDEKIEAIYAIGHSQYINGRYSDALNSFNVILTLDNLNRKAMKAFAGCLYMLGKYEEAMKHFALSVYMEPTDPYPIFNVAECMISLGRRKEATQILATLIKEFGSLDAHKNLVRKINAILSLLNKN